MKHPSHRPQLDRLRRIHGQVGGLVRMVEEDRYCGDILTQLRAVKSALQSVEQQVLKSHVDHCVAHAIESGDQVERRAKLDELFDILKRFQD